MPIKKLLLTALLFLVVGTSVAAIVRGNTQADGKVSVVASFYPLYDFAQQVGGDKVDVANMTPAGAEPHDYEPSAKALVTAQQSKVFIYDGGQLEPWAGKFLDSYKHIAVKASGHIQLMNHSDPHFWLDPALAQQVVDNIRDGLSHADPADSTYFAARAKAYNQQLAQLDQTFRQGLAQCQQHLIITSHQAFTYVSARYGFDVESIAGISPDEEPSAERLAMLSSLVKQKGIHYVFFESLVSPRLADTIAGETGAKTLVFDPLEGLSDAAQKQGQNYLSVQRENLANLRTALACQ